MVITPDLMRSLILECLRKPRGFNDYPWTTEIIWGTVAEVCAQRGLEYQAGMAAGQPQRNGQIHIHNNLKGMVSDIVWDLIVEGVIRPGKGLDGDHQFPWLHVTEFGKSVIAGQVTPYDPEGYLRHLSGKVPNADPVIVRYVSESAATLRQNSLLSSTVMLGVASEQAFLLLMEAYTAALNPTDQSTFTIKMGKLRSLKLQHDEFMDWWGKKLRAQVKPHFDSDWLTGIETSLNFVFGYFRDNRNSAGHPTDAAYTRELCSAHLVIFPTYLRLIYDLIEWLGRSPNL